MSLRERLPAVEALAPDRMDAVEERVMAAARGMRAGDARRGRVARAPWVPWAVWPVAAAAAFVVWMVMRGPAVGVTGPVEVVTGDGGTVVRWADATLRVAPRTRLTIARGEAVHVALETGGVDCEVVPRGGRPPFTVAAADVVVTVVGTRFAVEREGAVVGVAVTHGKVSVRDASGTRMLAAGERWASATVAGKESEATVAEAEPDPKTEPEPDPQTEPEAQPEPEAAAAPPRAAPARIFQVPPVRQQSPAPAPPGGDPKLLRKASLGSGKPAARALYELVVVTRDVELAEEYAVRFPRGEHAAEVAWVRVTALCEAGRKECRAAAHRFAEEYPADEHATDARRLATP